MDDSESTAEKTLNFLGLGTPDEETPAGAAFVAAVISGLIVGAIFWWWRGPGVALFVLVLALGQGFYREVARVRKRKSQASSEKKKR